MKSRYRLTSYGVKHRFWFITRLCRKSIMNKSSALTISENADVYLIMEYLRYYVET